MGIDRQGKKESDKYTADDNKAEKYTNSVYLSRNYYYKQALSIMSNTLF